ncbi:MAG TPA: response regulator [Verrucomicrobiae bacterium]|nr:response regulator [Verrucomicrobiae bacterium]
MSNGFKIAVVEDDSSIRDMYIQKLTLSGFYVQGAANGIGGLTLAERFQPDLILLDLLMPQMSGDKMLEHLRNTDSGANMRVVVLTNISRSEAPQVLRFLNVDRYIVKAHTTPTQVVDVVKEVLHIR